MIPDFRKIPELQLWSSRPTCDAVLEDYEVGGVFQSQIKTMFVTVPMVTWVDDTGGQHYAIREADWISHEAVRRSFMCNHKAFWMFTCKNDSGYDCNTWTLIKNGKMTNNVVFEEDDAE